MASTFARPFSAWFSEWWRSRLPTREAIVIAAFLVLLFGGSYLAAFFVRAELLLKGIDSDTILNTIGLVVFIKIVLFYWNGFCHRPWRAARFADLNHLLRTTTTGLLCLVGLNYSAHYLGTAHIPRSVLLLDWAFTLLGVGGMQALARSIYEEIVPATTAGNQRPVLVIDASEAGRALVVALGELNSELYHVAGILDDDPDHYGVTVGHARVLGPVSMAPMCAQRLRVGEIVISRGAVFGERLRALCDACAAVNARVKIADRRSSASADHGRSAPEPIHVRDLELHDLLARPAARLGDNDFHMSQFVTGRCLLVTGAGGSIGSEICRHIVRFHPARLVLVDRAEPALFAIHRELVESPTTAAIEVVPRLCDVGNPDRVDALLSEQKPDVIIHAAAHKHLPLIEHHPLEAIENNTLATATLAEIAAERGVETFISLSTDKAVYPSSLLGASKLVAERFLESLSGNSRTKFVVVRFGNVLTSSGSAVPMFTDRLRRGLPVTITDPAVRRYFLTLEEAAQLSLLAGASSPHGGVYVLDMGEPLPIVDVVASLAFLMGIPRDEVRIEYCGLRPGEKLEEDLFFADEAREPTASPLVIRARRSPRPLAEVQGWIAELREAVANGPEPAAAKLIQIASLATDGPLPAGSRPLDPSQVAVS